MFEGLFQPMHLLVIFGMLCSSSDPKSFRNLAKESGRESAASRPPLEPRRHNQP